MTKRIKIKKQVYYILIGIVLIIMASIFGNYKYKEYKYHQTYEYKLLNHGYNNEDVNKILNNFSEKDYNYFLNNDVNENNIKLLDEKYFLKKNFYKYIEYMNNNKKLDLTSVVRNINIHLDKNFYEEEFNTDVSKDTSMLVNKYYLLGSDYAPSDLVTISQTYSWGDAGSQKTRKVTYDAFLEMWNAAQEEQGYYLMVSSSYRSYQEQEIVYNNYKKTRGQKYADSIAARPGASEHQTGLTLDIFNKLNNNKNTFKDTDTAKWLENNAYRFGFILRYPEDKVKVTGYSYEAWHFRYVGKEIAKYVYENNITFEEYYAYYIEK